MVNDATSLVVKEISKKYGAKYWCVKSNLSNKGEIYAYADEVHVLPDGTLSLIRTRQGHPPEINLAIAPGNWSACFAASVIDGAAVAVEHWEGEVVRPKC